VEVVAKFCEISAKNLPVVANQMKERSFHVEFVNDVHELAKNIFLVCTKKGLSISVSPLKDLKQAIDSHLQRQPVQSFTWDEFPKIDWSLGDSLKDLNETRSLILANLKYEIRVYSGLPEIEKNAYYGSTVQKTILCSWQMMVPWISTNIFWNYSQGSVCPAFEILQNWIPIGRGGRWRTEDGGRRTEDGGWRTEDGGWRTGMEDEDRGWRTEDGGWRMMDRGQRTYDGG
jgi:hypothetical protein